MRVNVSKVERVQVEVEQVRIVVSLIRAKTSVQDEY